MNLKRGPLIKRKALKRLKPKALIKKQEECVNDIEIIPTFPPKKRTLEQLMEQRKTTEALIELMCMEETLKKKIEIIALIKRAKQIALKKKREERMNEVKIIEIIPKKRRKLASESIHKQIGEIQQKKQNKQIQLQIIKHEIGCFDKELNNLKKMLKHAFEREIVERVKTKKRILYKIQTL